MISKEAKQMFFRWLKEIHLYEEFTHNCRVGAIGYFDFERYLNNDKACIERLVLESFEWEKSKQGHGFWDKLHRKWMKELSKKEELLYSS